MHLNIQLMIISIKYFQSESLQRRRNTTFGKGENRPTIVGLRWGSGSEPQLIGLVLVDSSRALLLHSMLCDCLRGGNKPIHTKDSHTILDLITNTCIIQFD